MKTSDKYSFDKVSAIYQELRNERSEWDADARQVSEYVLPGRGIFQTYSKPRKRKLTNAPRVINTIAEDSLYILAAGIHGRLTSPAMPWFRIRWPSLELNQIEMIVAWLQESTKILHDGLHASNFYSVIDSFYVEHAGFGTGSIFVGDDTDDDSIPFRFELLTFGEYALAIGADGLPSVYCRTIFLSKRQLADRFPDTISKEVKQEVDSNSAGIDKTDLAVLEFISKDDSFQDKSYVRYMYEVTGHSKNDMTLNQEPLQIDGFYEFPYPTARWGTIGSDTYGIGPGSRAVPDSKRLQEMDKALLMATHKTINPPLNAPAKMKGKLNTLPGGFNYYSNPAETVNELYQVRFDYSGVGAVIERVEQRIQRNFYNDVFITASRDPNASPLRTGQVNAMKQEELFRLGPVTQRLNSEMFQPMIRRCFNIMHRKGMFPLLDPQFEELIKDIEIILVSPMATAQNQVKSQGVDAFMAFVAQTAQFEPAVMDNINIDEAARNRAEIEGVDYGVLRTEDEVKEIRQARAKQQAQQRQAEQQAAQAEQGVGIQNTDASTQKTLAETGQILAETQQTSRESGVALQ